MKARSVLLVVAAFLLGAIAAGSIGVRVIREVRTDEEAATETPGSTTTLAAGVAPTYQVAPNETLIGSTALVPTGIEAGGTDVAITYDLVVLAPYSGVPPLVTFVPFAGPSEVPVDEINHVYPLRWELVTTGGTFEGGPANPDIRVARFDVDEGFSPSEIQEVVIVEARTPYALEVPFTLSNDEPTFEVVPGVDVSLLNVSDQGSSTIVQVAIDADDPELASAFVSGDGPGWRSAVFEAEGRPRITLTYVGGPLPDPIPLVAAATVWLEVPGPFPVSIGAGS